MSTDILSTLTNCKVLSTVRQEDDYEGWKAARSRGIGGSEVGAICGVSNYASARTVYLRKTAQYDSDFSDEAKERMNWGHRLEPYVAQRFMDETGKKVQESPATLVHKQFPWAIANVDRFIVDDNGVPYGILECKTADARMREAWENGDFYLSYLYQLMWYMFVTGLKYGAIACLVGGNKYFFYEVYYNEELIRDEIFPKCDHFWNYNVKCLIEPELTGNQADSELVKGQYTEVVKKSEMELAEPEYDDLAEVVLIGKAKIKELEAQVEEAANKIKEKLGNTEIGYTGNHIVKWSPRAQERVDTDRLKSEYPDVYAACKKNISFRVFTVKNGG